MKTTDELFQALNNAESIDGLRSILRKYLVERLGDYKREPNRGETIAYEIAGLMAAQAVMSMSSEDPYYEIFSLAGELELPLEHRDKTSTWERFEVLVGRLPDLP